MKHNKNSSKYESTTNLRLYKVNFYVALVILLIMVNFSYYVFSYHSINVYIKSSGVIVNILPLHVEGKYLKDSLGNIVLLRGVNKVEFADDPDGGWYGQTYWHDEYVKGELDAMKQWGVNVVRCHMSVELWKYNIGPDSGHPASPYCTLSARQAIKKFIEFAAEKGIYVILDGFTLGCWYTGGRQDPLPFPPYQTTPNASSIIGSVEDFVDFWRSIATELKDYPNVLFELWNEPHGNITARTDWFNAVQQCIYAIREQGATQPIVVQWNTGCWINLNNPPPPPPNPAPSDAASVLDWIILYPLDDPVNNIIYSTHIYRAGGSFHKFPEPGHMVLCWEYSEIRTALQYMWFDYVLNTLNKTLLIGETGANLGYLDSGNLTEHEHEMIAWNNTLTIFDELNLSYAAFWWRNIGIHRLLEANKPWVPPPTEPGQILINALQGKG